MLVFFFLFIHFLSWDFCTKPLKWAWSGEKGAKERRLLSDNLAADGCDNKQDVNGMTCAVSEHPLVLPQQRWLQRPIRYRSVLHKILKVLSPVVWLIYLKIRITWTFAVVAVFLWNGDKEKNNCPSVCMTRKHQLKTILCITYYFMLGWNLGACVNSLYKLRLAGWGRPLCWGCVW